MADEQVQDQQQESGKIEKKFDEALIKVYHILGGDGLLKPKKKVKGDVVTEIVEELTKERTEANKASVKAELGTLLTKYVEYTTKLDEKEKELKKLKEDKQKEFTEAANKFFNKIDEVDTFAKQMAEALKVATQG